MASGSPAFSLNRLACSASACVSASVRVSCQTTAGQTGRPVARSHSTVVSRWLVMPSAAIWPSSRPAPLTASASTASTFCQISSASCSTQPGLGKIWRCSRWATLMMLPAWSKTMHRLDVVPWSMAAT